MQHVFGAQAVVRQRHQAVEPQVGHFADQLVWVAAVVEVFGGHDHLGGLFANFLQKRVGAFVQQTRHIAGVGVAAVGRFAAFNHGGQAGQGVVRAHGLAL